MRSLRQIRAVLPLVVAVGAAGVVAGPASRAATIDDLPRAAAAAPVGVRFATYNVRTGSLNNSWAGDNDAVYDREDGIRMRGVASMIKDRKLDLVSVQEVRNPERNGILAHLPQNFHATGVVGRSDTAVIWNSNVWEALGTGRYAVPVRAGITRPQVWVKLRHRQSGQRLVVFSVHFAAGDREAFRIEAARRTVQAVQRVARANGLPFIVAGDINGNDRDPNRIGAYRVFKNANLRYTREHAGRRFGNHCDSHNSRAGSGHQECRAGGRGSHIDMVWVSQHARVNIYNLVANARTSHISDHNPLITTLAVR